MNTTKFVGPDPTIQTRLTEMLKPELYGKSKIRVRLIQTHTSWVFIAGEFAYKVKKPVNFGFLDYTTLSARKFFCNEEFRLNRLLSPELYIGVLPITDRRGRLYINGPGQIIDYCVKMRALPQSALMTNLLEKDQVTFEQIDEIARKTADFHRQAERGPEIARYGSSEIVRLNWDENFAQTMEFRGKTITAKEFNDVKKKVERFIVRNRALFRKRREQGFVRRCHGDLHSKNIFITDRIYIFDCIEFNPRFSCCDVASEVAFMAMDLDYFNRHDLANFFVERYLIYSGDEDFLRLLNFYRCYRAYVRGKVISFQLNDKTISQKARTVAKATARKYFHLAWRYAQLLEEKPWLMVMFGLPATGKTYLAQRLADARLVMHLISDSIRKQIMGINVTEHRFEGYGKGIYSFLVSRRTYEEMLRRGQIFLRAGQPVILDATFLTEAARNQCREMAARLKIPTIFVWSYCPEKTVLERLRRRRQTTSFSDAKIEIYRMMQHKFQPPRLTRGVIKIDTRQPIKGSLRKIERALLHL